MMENLPFRPLDNSSSTRLRYSLEAEHWSEAYKSNGIRSRATNITEVGGLIGSLASLIAIVTVIVFTGLLWLIKKIIK